MRILFMGTPDFALPCLERIAADGHELCGVFTQTDKPKGRRMTLTPPPVKTAALKLNIPVYQPDTLKDEATIELIRSLKPQLIVVVAYGRILSQAVLDIPTLGCVNVHASLLPKYRGAGPIQWAVINGEPKTGITTMFMSKGIDTGDIILKEETNVLPEETAGELHDRLSLIGAELLSKTLRLFESGNVPREKQDDSLSCSAPMLDKSIAKIDFLKPAVEIHNLVRGMSPWPIAYTLLKGRTLKIYKTKLADGDNSERPGIVISTSTEGIYVSCGNGDIIIIEELQAEGGRRMMAADYILGHPINNGEELV